jgi:hypothetical protein
MHEVSDKKEEHYEEVNAIFLHETEKAMLLTVDHRDLWFPKSQLGEIILCTTMVETFEGDTVPAPIKDEHITIMIKPWILDKHGVNYGD